MELGEKLEKQRKLVKRIRQLYCGYDFAYVLGFGVLSFLFCSMAACFLLLSEGLCCSLRFVCFSGLKIKFLKLLFTNVCSGYRPEDLMVFQSYKSWQMGAET